MELKGKIVNISEKRTGTSASGNAWSAVTFVVEYNEGNYQRRAALDIFGDDKISTFSTLLEKGKDVAVSFDIDARESANGHWFNGLKVWKIEASSGEAIAPQTSAQVFPTATPVQEAQPVKQSQPAASLFHEQAKQANNGDDLPF